MKKSARQRRTRDAWNRQLLCWNNRCESTYRYGGARGSSLCRRSFNWISGSSRAQRLARCCRSFRNDSPFEDGNLPAISPVSYTHLPLPTIYSV